MSTTRGAGFIPSSSSPDAIVGISVIHTSQVTCNRKFIVDPAESEQIDMPVFAFLIEKAGKYYMFDLGIRPDFEVIPEAEYKAFVPKTLATLPASLPVDVSIETVFVSHYHWDHIGNPGLLPKGTPIFGGPGTLEAIGEGYPTGDPFVDPEWLTHCKWADIEMNSGSVGSFPRSKDWFGDGSLWLIDCPGHCKGNMVALARVTAFPDTYVALGGDCAHDQEFLYHENGVCPCRIARYTTCDGDQASLHEDHHVAYESMAKLRDLNDREEVMTILSHERQVVGVIPCLQSDGTGRNVLRNWRTAGWKEAKLKQGDCK